jgi:proteic killer suppression protein
MRERGAHVYGEPPTGAPVQPRSPPQSAALYCRRSLERAKQYRTPRLAVGILVDEKLFTDLVNNILRSRWDVDILFKTNELKSLCDQEKTAKKKLGAIGAKKLRTRLADLAAAENMGAVKFGRPHVLKGELAGCIALDLDGGCRLVVAAANDPIPTNATDGSILWDRVDTICVVYIGDYHD